MKGTRLKDVLDEKVFDRDFWQKMFDKMSVLAVKIENAKGSNMSIDDPEYRWVTDRLEYWTSEERLLTKEEMLKANDLWRIYGR